jgi:predicted phosphate transport protein (TIGR00153 family)
MHLLMKKKDTDFLALLISAAENALQGAHLFRTAMMGDKPPAEYFPEMKDLENKGDSITHQIFKGLNQTFITPLDREDIMALASQLDNVIDGIEATLARFDYLNVQTTDNYMKEFSGVFVSSCQHILDAFKLLAKKKYLQISQHTVQINALENEGDRLMREGIREIFTHQRDPYTDFKLKELYERMETTTDACEDVADILDSVVLRYS